MKELLGNEVFVCTYFFPNVVSQWSLSQAQQPTCTPVMLPALCSGKGLSCGAGAARDDRRAAPAESWAYPGLVTLALSQGVADYEPYLC